MSGGDQYLAEHLTSIETQRLAGRYERFRDLGWCGEARPRKKN
jgi:hypothetical protein